MANYPVIWAPRAEAELIEVLTYLEQFFGPDIAADCVIQTDAAIEKLANYPRMYPAFGSLSVRKAVIHRNLSLIYRFEREEIHILKVLDNRQGPNKIKGNYPAAFGGKKAYKLSKKVYFYGLK